MLKINSYLVCKKIKQKTNNLYVFLIHKTENYKAKEPKKELIVQKQKWEPDKRLFFKEIFGFLFSNRANNAQHKYRYTYTHTHTSAQTYKRDRQVIIFNISRAIARAPTNSILRFQNS